MRVLTEEQKARKKERDRQSFQRNKEKRLAVQHQHRESRRKSAGMKPCGCGCGELMPALTLNGEPATYKYNHHSGVNLDLIPANS